MKKVLLVLLSLACLFKTTTVAAGEIELIDRLLKKFAEKGVLTQQKADEIGTELKSEIEMEQKTEASARNKILPNGDTQVSVLDKVDLKVGIQSRVMYDASNIPVSGVTTARDTEHYDFFRQRIRLNIDARPAGVTNAGGFLQAEFRGGWGGSSPSSSDPRSPGLSLNAFNRLDARGIRYGYLYYTPTEESSLTAGIIPVSDQVGDTLFSADWDFNVGGITYNDMIGDADYRLGFVRLVDGISSADSSTLSDNGNLYIADINYPLTDDIRLGGHVYYFFVNSTAAIESGLTSSDDVSQGWYTVTGEAKIKDINVNSFVSVNSGDFGSTDNTGVAAKIETVIPVEFNDSTLKLMGLYASGDTEGSTADDQYRTLQGILGTQGYWAYTHIFTANGPSDINDLGVGINNGGRGLVTVQANLGVPINDNLAIDLFGGYFQAASHNSEDHKNMGEEFGFMLNYKLAKNLNLQSGFSYAILGDFYESGGEKQDNLYEGFGRLQLQF